MPLSPESSPIHHRTRCDIHLERNYYAVALIYDRCRNFSGTQTFHPRKSTRTSPILSSRKFIGSAIRARRRKGHPTENNAGYVRRLMRKRSCRPGRPAGIACALRSCRHGALMRPTKQSNTPVPRAIILIRSSGPRSRSICGRRSGEVRKPPS